MTKNVKVAMIVAAYKVLEYIKAKPNAESEEIISYIMKEIKSTGNSKLAAIAAANRVINYKRQSPSLKDKEAMQKLMNELNDILTSIEE